MQNERQFGNYPTEAYDRLSVADENFRDAWHGGVYEKEQEEESEGCGFDQVDEYERYNDDENA